MSKYKVCDGNSACANIAYMFSELCAIYPITPSSPMASEIDLLSNKKTKNIFNDKVNIIEMQSEAGAAGALHGALISGSLASTFTASQGLLLMIPNMYKIAGEMLPGVIHCASRSLATHALSIFGDHQDIYACRSTGFCMLSSTNVYDAQNLAIVAHLSAISGSLPFLHFFDGFRTSHEVNKIKCINLEQIINLVDYKAIEKFRKRAINVGRNIERGTAENEDIYFQSVEARNKDYEDIVDIVVKNMNKVNKLMQTDYAPFNYYGVPDAEEVIIAMGSVCDTTKIVVNELNKKGHKVGVINVHLYRPFSTKYLQKVLPKTVKNIAVLDRTKEMGSTGPLYQDVVSSLKNMDINIVGGRYGLSSKNTTPADIKSVFTMLESNLKDDFTISIIDDLTNKSLPAEEYEVPFDGSEIKIYGYGSDGMVSASKSILKIVGTNTHRYVQGYFQYDSKKSGGITSSNLRFSNYEINNPYYVTKPNLVVITKDEYLNKLNMLDDICHNGIVLLNTSNKKMNLLLPDKVKKIINEKELKLFVIDANKIALNNKIGNKISMIMANIILNMIGIEDGQSLIAEFIKDKFKTKGNNVVTGNLNAIKEGLLKVKEVKEKLTLENTKEKKKTMFEMMNSLQGDKLKVSELYPYRDGTFPGGLTALEKRKVAVSVPKWNKNKCIECNQCSLSCPHGVIRPFIIDANDKYAGLSKESITEKGKNFIMAVSEADCTGCEVCVNVCPVAEKALMMGEYSKEKQGVANDLFKNYKNNVALDRFTLKGSQFQKPLFEFSGACAGCGETPYIKLLTQLFQEKLIVANATGCSSIYGASAPNTPYSIPWANSLFEDNAEFGLGMFLSYETLRTRLVKLIKEELKKGDSKINKIYKLFIENIDNYDVTLKIKNQLSKLDINKDIKALIDYIPSRSVFAIGGDGWAYDIGFGGIDHVIASGKNVNIMVLDTEVYSNTGGQASKSSHPAQVAEFANLGKRTSKKDLFKIAMSYNNVYVASVSLGANPLQTIRAMKEAEEFNGPSIIIAYSPCLEHGISCGLSKSPMEQKMAVECGYVLLMRYNGKTKELLLDSKEPNFEKYEDFLTNEVRYNALKIKDEKLFKQLVAINKKDAMNRYNYYHSLAQKK